MHIFSVLLGKNVDDMIILNKPLPRSKQFVDLSSDIAVQTNKFTQKGRDASVQLLKDLKLKTSYLVVSEEKIKIEDFLKPFKKLMDSTRKGLSLQRYKGLGEMNPEQLWDTTMNPVGRRLVQVKIEDADEASDLFEQLMGDNVENRREFIESNASLIGNIDI